MPDSRRRPRAMVRRAGWAGAALCSLGLRDAPAQQLPIDTVALRAHTFFLSHDLLRGRGAGTAEERVAALYLAAECRAAGLLPIGERYLQTVQLEEATILPKTHLWVERGPVRMEFGTPSDFVVNLGTRATLVGFAGRAVYVGGNRDVGERTIDLPLRGAVAVSAGVLDDEAMRTLRARGVVGVVHVVASDERFRLYAASRGARRLYLADPAVRSSFFTVLPALVASPGLGDVLLAAGPRGAGPPGPPRVLDVGITFGVELERRRAESANVGCLLPGEDPAARDTAIVLAAHLDHLGVGAADPHGDSIYNGFSDNAAGVGMLLAIANGIRRTAALRPRHSLLLLFFGAEEGGLLGSDHYTHAPLWPLERTLAVITLDAGAPPAPPTSWELAGVDSTGLGRVALDVAAGAGWGAATSHARPISDFYAFHRRGVPSVLIIPGREPYEGMSREQSAVLKRQWDRYHRPDDEWSPRFPLAGLVRYARFTHAVVHALDTTAVDWRHRLPH